MTAESVDGMASGKAAPIAAVGTRPALVAESVEVRRGDVAIVTAFTLTHEAGSVAWLIGPNGAGKTSLMRVLAGLEAPTAGRVERLSRAGHPSRVGYYHPAMALPPEAFASAFTRLTDELVSGPKSLRPERPLAGKRCGSLSTGEAKRLLLGAVLAREPDFLMLDEPYEHVSEGGRAELTAVLERIGRRSVVVVSTNQELPAGTDGTIIRLDVREPEAG